MKWKIKKLTTSSFTFKLFLKWFEVTNIFSNMPNSMDYFDTIMTYLLSAQFSFYLHDKFSVVSKVHYESIFFFEFISHF
jgi:hypothetical protein